MLFHDCKFQNDELLTRYLSLGLNQVVKHWEGMGPDVGTLVPSSRKKGIRSYHPAFHLFQRLQRHFGFWIAASPQKLSQEKQSEQSFENRFFHAKKAFEIPKSDRSFGGLHVLIVDDIFTTGASLNELSRMYLERGASRVSCVVLMLSEGD
ncbi:phosphoribosyltransferase family protein [Leptospira sp. 96542]|nr:phosphoribosyltransferase family protein [Leptospira sp. 96542]